MAQDAQLQPEADPYDYSADPILQRIRAFAEMRRADAQAEAQRLRAQLDIDYGIGEAGEANPFSVRAKLRQAREREPKALLENLNEQNLFYSGTRATRETDLQRDLLERETNAENAYRGAQGDISARLRQALLGADEDVMGGEEEAAGRLQSRLGDLQLQRPMTPRATLPTAARSVAPRAGLRRAIGARPVLRPRPRRGRLPE